jgi:hypothetical protein
MRNDIRALSPRLVAWGRALAPAAFLLAVLALEYLE